LTAIVQVRKAAIASDDPFYELSQGAPDSSPIVNAGSNVSVGRNVCERKAFPKRIRILWIAIPDDVARKCRGSDLGEG
jgi:hypothetical protein